MIIRLNDEDGLDRDNEVMNGNTNTRARNDYDGIKIDSGGGGEGDVVSVTDNDDEMSCTEDGLARMHLSLPVVSLPSTFLNNTRGTTCAILLDKNKRKILMACDGYGLDEKRYQWIDGKLLRTDRCKDVTPDFSPGTVARKYYVSLLRKIHKEFRLTSDEVKEVKSSWVRRRKNWVVVSDDEQKITVFRKTNKILCCFAGTACVFSKIKEELMKRGEWLTFDECISTSERMLRDINPEDYKDYTGSCLLTMGNSLLFGTYLKTHEGVVVPRLVLVTKAGWKNISRYKSIGTGKEFVEWTLDRHVNNKDEGGDLGVLRLREGLESASVKRMSGGVIRIVSLDEDDIFQTEWEGRIGC